MLSASDSQGSHVMAADSTGAGEPLGRRMLICGGCGYGIFVVRLPPFCPMCNGFDWQPRGSAGIRGSSTEEVWQG